MTNAAETWTDFEIDPALPGWANRTADSMAQGLRDTAPRGKGNTAGRFANSIDAQPADGYLAVEGEGDAIPGTFLLTGTAAHLIEGNPILHWEDAEGDHFARSVHHPGTEPSDFVARTIDAHQEEWESDLLDSIAQQWAGG